MLLLCFSLGDERFVLDASKVKEVIQLVRIKKMPKVPDWVAGVIRYHGKMVPVIDLCALNLDRNADRRMSTRIILVHFIGQEQSGHLLGLIAEQVNQTIRKDAEDFASAGVNTPGAPYLGGIANEQGSMLQLVDINELLPEHVQNVLFQDVSEAG